ncbi:MAG: amidohydrolase [Gammaproteobacteria bacterium]|nr:MAG: amidohydrolase [Gammaproteobacteria bacterium]
MKIIDPHIHLFSLDQGDYHWLKADNPPFWSDKNKICQNFTEHDLRLTEHLELAGFVHIEAGFDNNKPWREIAYLEQHCHLPFRAIAYIDLLLNETNFKQQLQKLLKYKSVVGCRYILDEQALTVLSAKNTLKNLALLAHHNLIFEVQMSLNANTAVTKLMQLLTQLPALKTIINHAGWPSLMDKKSQQWLNNLQQLSQFNHCAIKCSGWEMTNRNYQATWLNENLSLIFTIFGAKNMMLASNFPLCLFSHNNYQAYWQSIISSDFFQTLTEKEKSALCYDNALSWYSMRGILN